MEKKIEKPKRPENASREDLQGFSEQLRHYYRQVSDEGVPERPERPFGSSVEEYREYKKALRRYDDIRIKLGISTPSEIQKENSPLSPEFIKEINLGKAGL